MTSGRQEPGQGRPAPPDERRLMELGRDLVAELDLETVLERLLEIARDLTGARYVALGVLDEEHQGLERLLTLGVDAATREEIGMLPRGLGLLGALARESGPLRLSRIADHPSAAGFPAGHPPMSSFLGVSIHIGGRAYGDLYLTDKRDGDFDSVDEDAVFALAGWAAIAIENARLYRAEAARRQQLEETARRYDAMTEIARAVGGVPDLDRVLAVVAGRTRDLVDARAAVVNLLDGDDLVVSAVAGDDVEGLVGRRYRIRGSVGGHALERERATHLHEAPPELGAIVMGRLQPRGALFVPLTFRGRPLGVLSVFDRLSDGPAFSADDALVIEGIAASAATGVATAQGVAAHALRRSMAAAERERQRWARELHDQTLQDLAGLRLMMDALSEVEDPRQASVMLARASERVSEAIAQLRHLVAELRPLVLDDLGIEPALHALAARVDSLSGASVETAIDLAYDAGRAPSRLAPEVEETIYRVVQESLNNCLKHAGATHIKVGVEERGPLVEITVTDDGGGFDAARQHTGFGLIGMRERLELVGGRLRVTASNGEGTTVRATIPVARAERTTGSSKSAVD